jgi:hypothetical protein
MISDGDRSGSSSPPSTNDDEGEESLKMTPLDILGPADQLVALADMLPPAVAVGSYRPTDTTSQTVETAAYARASHQDPPLTYASLEERSNSSSSLRRLGEVADRGFESSIQNLPNESHSSHLSTNDESVCLPLVSLKGASKSKVRQGALTGSDSFLSDVALRFDATGTKDTMVKTKLRRGKWTVEEEAYVARVIQDFNSGFLDAPAGTTLRTYLSEKLKCDPMRITKKFTGDACIGKRVFHPAVRSSSNAASIDRAQVRWMLAKTLLCVFGEAHVQSTLVRRNSKHWSGVGGGGWKLNFENQRRRLQPLQLLRQLLLLGKISFQVPVAKICNPMLLHKRRLGLIGPNLLSSRHQRMSPICSIRCKRSSNSFTKVLVFSKRARSCSIFWMKNRGWFP